MLSEIPCIRRTLPAALLAVLTPATAFASADSGDTAWLLTATALVLFMTIPGLALFYADLVRTRNVLSVLMQCFVLVCSVTVLWVVLGYSLAFGEGGMGGALGMLLTAVFVSVGLGGAGYAEGVTMGSQFLVQALAVIATVIWSALVSYVVLKIAGAVVCRCGWVWTRRSKGLTSSTMRSVATTCSVTCLSEGLRDITTLRQLVSSE